ncbi:hypothetical protein GQ602_005529 [Ophiocordyceps camponoti-floridani]|uniref:Extracellular membrane protein CFEM domain-containing protein n=1 Tax=Ophiocordyceps camponoti-floridani TaxID=2030778 RepID=A0A8H4VBY7_9HYPO|nr:hypothetical protein GQ602_005529 [Ophiocordyceps camponoti-floridani]
MRLSFLITAAISGLVLADASHEHHRKCDLMCPFHCINEMAQMTADTNDACFFVTGAPDAINRCLKKCGNITGEQIAEMLRCY